MSTIKIKCGDMLKNATSGHILHGCNAQGVMGGGVALLVKQQYPKAFEDYSNRYHSQGFTLGTAYPVRCDAVTIWNMITQEHYGYLHTHLDMRLIQSAFKDFVHKLNDCDDIHMPLIGCGLAKGKVGVVIPVICDILRVLANDVTIWVIEPELVESLTNLLEKR
jgi:O-acetyl-ADP-ribose deacetylase (regulator of RNase III)